MGLPAQKTYQPLVVNRRNNYDPTRTISLRRSFERELTKRFRELRGVIRKAIVEEDVFGLMEPTVQQMESPGRKRFSFPRNSQKVSAFMEWLRRQEENGILETTNINQVGQSIDSAWTNTYINDSYKRGVIRARAELRVADYDAPSIEESGGIQASMSTPFHVDRVGVLYTRAFNRLKGITDAMDSQISQVLAQGLVDGDNPRLLARKLNGTISGKNLGELGLTDSVGRFIPAERRARMLSRTEIIRAHHQATIQEYKNWRVEGVKVKAEFVTAGDNRTCERCELRAAQGPYRLEEIQNMIPLHPQCRCIAIPLRKGVDQPFSGRDRQVRGRQQEPWQVDPVAKRFRTAELGRRYMELKQTYRTIIDENLPNNVTGDIRKVRGIADESAPSFQIKSKIIESDPDLEDVVIKNLGEWQENTHLTNAVAIKQRANMLEDTPELFVKRGDAEDTLNFAKDALTNDQYLKIRAANQAYMEKRGIDKKMLYRGTNGGEGEQIRKSIIDNSSPQRQQFPMKDNAVAGYSDDVNEADNFGYDRGGVTVRNEFDRSDIVIHKDFLSGWTGQFLGEQEYIVIGLNNKQVNIKDFKIINAGTKDFGETKIK